jgi:hypothetical protein
VAGLLLGATGQKRLRARWNQPTLDFYYSRKSMTMKAILIDPVKLEITEVQIGDDYKEIYGFIDAGTFECIQINKDGDLLYIDEEGLFTKKPVFAYNGISHPIVGKALIIGNNKRTGEARDAVITRDQVSAAVSFPMVQS